MRCFVAIELPDSIRRRLGELQSKLRAFSESVHWSRPEQMHLTLKFLGEVPDAQVPEVCQISTSVAARYPAFEMEVSGTGCFPPGGSPRVLWAAILAPPVALMRCQYELEQALATFAAPEARAYSPHLTLGRVREGRTTQGLRQAMRELETFSAGRCHVSELTVFQSILGKGGALHVPLARAPLKADR